MHMVGSELHYLAVRLHLAGDIHSIKHGGKVHVVGCDGHCCHCCH